MWKSSAVAHFIFDRSHRTQVIALLALSELQSLCVAFNRRSVLGPLLFVLYYADVNRIAASHGICVHAYVDDRPAWLQVA